MTKPSPLTKLVQVKCSAEQYERWSSRADLSSMPFAMWVRAALDAAPAFEIKPQAEAKS